MNRLWVRLSFAFSGVIVLAGVLSFTILFVTSWVLPDESLTIDEVIFHYEDEVVVWLEQAIIAGRDDEAIIGELQRANGEMLTDLVSALRAEGFAAGVDIEDRSLARILGDFIDELFTEDSLRWIILGGLIGIVAGIWMSRTLAAPLNRLAEAAQAFGRQDLSRRVTVGGSQEMIELGETFNQMAAELEHAEQLRQNLLADVSHELRTPLTALEGSLRAALDHVYDLDEERLARLYTQTRHLSRLVEDLRVIAQAEARRLPLHLQPINITQIIHETAEIFNYQAEEEGITLNANLATNLPPLHADEGRLRQVLHNLLANALRHTPHGGRVTISTHRGTDHVQIAITDSGEGIAPEHLPQLFDRFYRADKSRSRNRDGNKSGNQGGTGLGLAIVKAITEAHGGQITAKSDGLGHGSTFTLSLPLKPA